MDRPLQSFKIRLGKRLLDYRIGEQLELEDIESFFKKNYSVKKIWAGPRHIFGILFKQQTFFLKLATSEGISVATKNESEWNNLFNHTFLQDFSFKVPRNYKSGIYKNKYFYLITDYFEGQLLCSFNGSKKESDNIIGYADRVIDLSEIIQKIPIKKDDQKADFFKKARNWLEDIPINVRQKYKVHELFRIIEDGIVKLQCRVRHGDFAPWHIIILEDNSLSLLDGEHFRYQGVENYDICYFIQRIFSVLKNSDVALNFYHRLIERGYQKDKLKTVLAARAIGGFLDEFLNPKPNYRSANDFKNWILQI